LRFRQGDFGMAWMMKKELVIAHLAGNNTIYPKKA
jgi:hypothetical protein